MPLQDDYQVRLDAFCGPLDLLLYLIRRAEVDVHDVPIATITDQYLAFLRGLDDIDIEAAGEFLVMAATLMEIKSRTLVPPAPMSDEAGEGADDAGPAAAGEPTDPRFELVRQLLEYQRYRLASETLDRRRREFERRFAAQPVRADEPGGGRAEAELELDDAHVYDLYESYGRIIASIDFARLGDHLVEIDDTPAALYQQDLLDRLQRTDAGRLALQDVFQGQRRLQRIGLFLAALELVRLRRVRVCQEDLLSEILVELRPPEAEDEPAGGPVAPQGAD